MTVAPDGTAPGRLRNAGRRMARRRSWLVVSLVIVVAALAGYLVTRPASSSTAGAPAVAGPTAGGGRYSLAAERGHWVLVNFFASWCTNCRAELSQLATLQHRHPAGLQVVSVDGLDDSFTKAAGLIRAGGGSWPLVNDPVALSAYRVDSLPQSFLVGPDGTIREHVFGGVTAKAFTARLTKLAG